MYRVPLHWPTKTQNKRKEYCRVVVGYLCTVYLCQNMAMKVLSIGLVNTALSRTTCD